MPTIATEKTINYIFRPVLKTRPKKEFPYMLEAVDKRKDGNLILDNYWTGKNHMILDMLTNELLEDFHNRANKGDIITSHFEKSVKNEAENISVWDIKYLSDQKNYERDKNKFKNRLNSIESEVLSLNEKDLIKRYSFLNGMTSTQIYQSLKDISLTKFKCGFRVKVLTDNKKSFTHYNYYMWVAEPLFNMEEFVLEQTKHNPPRVKLRKYIIGFNGILGRLFAHNVKALNITRMPIEIYRLSQDAQFIYRRFIATMVIRKGHKESGKFKIEQNALERYMDMKVDHNTFKKKRVNNALKELKDAGFIEFKMINGRRHDYITYEVIRRC